MMMGYGWGMGPAGWIFMALFWIVIIGLAVWAVVALLPGNRAGGTARTESPREILDRRFARGEIDVDQYRLARTELSENQPERR
jgi:putative membrane protein